MDGGSTRAIEVFYSYAHKDAYWRKRLETHLSTLHRQGMIAGWYDRNISAGTAWAIEIDEHLNRAGIIMLLISPDFIASDYCYSIEAKRAMERHMAGNARVIPVLLRPSDLKGTPFAHLQALPTGARPITTWSNRDQAFQNVVQGLREVIEELHAHGRYTGTAVDHSAQQGATLTASSLRVWNLPYRRNPFFTGREDLLNELHDYFTRAHTTALTQPPAITGLGGIGKTQLAIEYAYRYKQEYQHVFWVAAATRETLNEGFVGMAKLIGLPTKDENEQLKTVNAVRQWLETQSGWLLILDNADDSTLLREFLPAAENGHVLLTTRERAWGTLAHSFEVEKMDQSEGMLFLLRRAKVLRSADSPLSEASSADQTMAQAIVKALDGLPLALDQAGAYIEETPSTVAGYLKAYERRRHKLLHERGNEPASHPAAVATTWSLNFEQVERLNPTAADLLRCLAFLAPDAIPEEIITAGAGELGPQLQALASDETLLDPLIKILSRFSLLQRNPESHLLSIHRLVQAVFRATMTHEVQQAWAERTVRAVNRAFPDVSVDTREQCERLLPHALVCAELINEYRLDLPEAASLLNETGYYLNYYIQPEQARPLFERALAIREQVLGPNHPHTARSLSNLAELYRKQGDYEHARPLHEQALTIYEQVLGPSHPDTARSLNNLAALYDDQDDYERARPLYERALAIREQVLGPTHPDTAQSLNNLATLHHDLGNHEHARPLYERALAISEQVLGPTHPDTARGLNNLAALYHNQADYKHAKPLFERALTIYEQVLGPTHPATALSLNNLAALYRDQGDYEHARSLYERALAIMEKILGSNHPNTKIVRENYAGLLEKIQEKEKKQ